MAPTPDLSSIPLNGACRVHSQYFGLVCLLACLAFDVFTQSLDGEDWDKVEGEITGDTFLNIRPSTATVRAIKLAPTNFPRPTPGAKDYHDGSSHLVPLRSYSRHDQVIILRFRACWLSLALNKP